MIFYDEHCAQWQLADLNLNSLHISRVLNYNRQYHFSTGSLLAFINFLLNSLYFIKNRNYNAFVMQNGFIRFSFVKHILCIDEPDFIECTQKRDVIVNGREGNSMFDNDPMD